MKTIEIILSDLIYKNTSLDQAKKDIESYARFVIFQEDNVTSH